MEVLRGEKGWGVGGGAGESEDEEKDEMVVGEDVGIWGREGINVGEERKVMIKIVVVREMELVLMLVQVLVLRLR